MTPSETDQLRAEVEKRGITRLCHFTRLSSFKSILADEAIYSQLALLYDMPGIYRFNDSVRFDRQLDHICCTIQYPNCFLLDKYRRRNLAEPWVIVHLTPALIWGTNTLFSQVNAATEGGARIKEGLVGFLEMYDDIVFGANSTETRSSRHDPACPTALQAEVLVHNRIGVESIRHIICETPEAKEEVVDAIVGNPTWSTVEARVDPNVFDVEFVKSSVRRA